MSKPPQWNQKPFDLEYAIEFQELWDPVGQQVQEIGYTDDQIRFLVREFLLRSMALMFSSTPRAEIPQAAKNLDYDTALAISIYLFSQVAREQLNWAAEIRKVNDSHPPKVVH